MRFYQTVNVCEQVLKTYILTYMYVSDSEFQMHHNLWLMVLLKVILLFEPFWIAG